MRRSRRKSFRWARVSSLVKFAPIPLVITITSVRSSMSSQFAVRKRHAHGVERYPVVLGCNIVVVEFGPVSVALVAP